MLRVALRALVGAVALLPWSALGPCGAFVGWLAGSVLRIRRAAVVAAMQRASVEDADAQARAMYAGLGAGLLELLWLAGARPARRAGVLREHVVLDADLDQALRTACARGPVVLAASHTANWELVAYGAAQTLASRGARLAVVAKPLSVGVFHVFCTNLRTACGLVQLAPEGALGAARRRLAAGDVIAMPIDQVPDRAQHGLSVSFLGAGALADRAPAALARSVGATLLVVGATRDGPTQRAHLLAELPSSPRVRGQARGSSRAPATWIAEATRDSTGALEAFVRLHPSAWLWLHRRWRAPLERTTARPARLVATRHPG